MERIEAQPFLHKKTKNAKKAIAAIRETREICEIRESALPALDAALNAASDAGAATVAATSHWLSSAMAIWLQDDQDQEPSQARGMR
jgi:hypothetical protein